MTTPRVEAQLERSVQTRKRPRVPIETPEYADMVTRMVRAYGRRVADGDEADLARMLELRGELEAAIAVAVRGQRERFGQSWAYVGRPRRVPGVPRPRSGES